jgi:hypothetical protein
LKNKTKTYLLLATVLAIWGVIGFKITNGLSPNKISVENDNLDVDFTPKTIALNETFEISNVERDPFLGTLVSTRKSKPKRSQAKKKVEIESPKINYLGLVKSQNSTEPIFVVNIDNNQQLLKRGQEVDGVKLIKGDTKRIIISWNNKYQTISIQ